MAAASCSGLVMCVHGSADACLHRVCNGVSSGCRARTRTHTRARAHTGLRASNRCHPRERSPLTRAM